MLKVFSYRIFAIFALISLLSACTRDLSSSTYVSNSTLSLTLEGKILSVRPVTIKDSDDPSNNVGGMVAGGLLGAAVGSNIGGGGGKTVATVGAGLAGAAIGAVVQDKMSTSKGSEYIVKLDMSKFKDGYYEGNTAMRNVISTARTSGVITVVQGDKDGVLAQGQKVYVIFSNDRTRVIPAN